MHLDTDAPVSVGPRLLALRPHHRGGLRAAGARLRLGPLGPEQHVRRLRREGDLATPLLADARRFGNILDLQIGAEDQVLAVCPVLDEMAQPERAARHDRAHVATSARPAAVLAQCLHPQPGDIAAFAPRVVVGGGLAMVAWIFIDLGLGMRGIERRRRAHREIRAWLDEIVVELAHWPDTRRSCSTNACRHSSSMQSGAALPANDVVRGAAVRREGTVGIGQHHSAGACHRCARCARKCPIPGSGAGRNRNRSRRTAPDTRGEDSGPRRRAIPRGRRRRRAARRGSRPRFVAERRGSPSSAWPARATGAASRK